MKSLRYLIWTVSCTYATLGILSAKADHLCIAGGHIEPVKQECVSNTVEADIVHEYKVCDETNKTCGPLKQEIVTKKFKCEKGKSLCNPMVFGYHHGEPDEYWYTPRNNMIYSSSGSSYKFTPYCVDTSEGPHFSQKCYIASIEDKQNRPLSLKYNSALWDQYQNKYKHLCSKKSLDAKIEQARQQNLGFRSIIRTRDICDWANFRLSKYQDLTDENGKPITRFIDHGDPNRPEPGEHDTPALTLNKEVKTPYQDVDSANPESTAGNATD